jgi:hypothetical protein
VTDEERPCLFLIVVMMFNLINRIKSPVSVTCCPSFVSLLVILYFDRGTGGGE